MNTRRLWLGMVAAVFVFSTFTFRPALAQQDKKLILRVADQFPTTHFMPRYGIKPWMEHVTKATNGYIQFEYYPAEQLGKAKDLLSLVQSGVADIATFAPSYASDKMPLTAALELPGMFSSSCQGTYMHWELAKPGGFLARREHAPNGVRALFSAVFPPYQIVSTKRKIEDLKDIEGMKLRVLGGAMELTMHKLKALGIKMVGSDMFEATTKGTLDGVILSHGGVLTYNLPAKYLTAGDNFGSAATIFIIGENRWKQLPEHVKKVMMDAGEMANRSACEGMDREEAGALEKLQQKGATVVRWSDTEKKELDIVMTSVAKEWAMDLDKRGKPASEMLKAVLEARGHR